MLDFTRRFVQLTDAQLICGAALIDRGRLRCELRFDSLARHLQPLLSDR